MSLSNCEATSPQCVADPAVQQMAGMIRAFWISQIVGTIAQLGIPDRLAGGALAPGLLARRIACHAGATHRLMRAAMELGLVTSTPDGRFSLTALGETLRSDVPGSMRDSAIALTAPGHWLPWGRLSEAVRTGRRQTPETLGAELFQYYSDNPNEGCAFTGAMSVLRVEGLVPNSTMWLCCHRSPVPWRWDSRRTRSCGRSRFWRAGFALKTLSVSTPDQITARLAQPRTIPTRQEAVRRRIPDGSHGGVLSSQSSDAEACTSSGT